MGSRMDKYNDSNIPKRSEKNKELYKQIYNAYDEFENLVVPSNSKEIDLDGLKREISGKEEHKSLKEYDHVDVTNNKVARKEMVVLEQKKENEIYDINELLNKAVKDNKKIEEQGNTLTTDSYLKKLKLDDTRTNLDIMKEMYEDIKKEAEDESEDLLRTANLSLEILSDLKGDNDNTMIEAPIKEEFVFEDEKQFYSNKYKFSKKDFDEAEDDNFLLKDEPEEEEVSSEGNGKFFFKILLLVFGISLVVVISIYLISYFNRG